MRRAAGNKSVKAALGISRPCLGKRFPCPFAKSSNQKRSFLLYPTPAKHQQSRLASKDLSAQWLQHRSWERMRGRPSISTGNPRRCLVRGHFPRSLPPDGHSLKSKSHRTNFHGGHTIPSLRWWIGALLFASTVINYIDRQTLSLLAPYLNRTSTGLTRTTRI
jgi:hypothetical protein